MTNTKILGFREETVTVATGNLTQAVNRPKGASGFELSGTANAVQLCPTLVRAFWDNNGTFSDETANVTERGTTNFAEIDAFATSDDQFYWGSYVPFRGVYVNVKNANGTASVMTVEYWNGSAWTDASATDNTASGGATLAVDDHIDWSVPTDWAKTSVNGIGNLYWARFNVSVTLDADVQIAEFVLLNVLSNGVVPLAIPGTVTQKPRYWFDTARVGGIEVTGDNTETGIITWLLTEQSQGFIDE